MTPRRVAAALAGLVLVSSAVSCDRPTPAVRVQKARPAPTAVPGQPPDYQPTYFGSTRWPRIRGTCDLKEFLLERDAVYPGVDSDGDGCRDDGPVLDPYTRETVPAVDTEPDHVLSKEDAWYGGAWRWTAVQRRMFFADQANLLTVRNRVNESKGGRGPDRWRPPRVGWCAYSTVYSATAQRWQLELTEPKRVALREMQATCKGQ